MGLLKINCAILFSFFAVILSVPIASLCDTDKNGGNQQINLKSEEAITRLSLEFLYRHKRLHNLKGNFHKNIDETLSHADRLISENPILAQEYPTENLPFVGTTYQQGIRFEEAKLGEARSFLKARAEALLEYLRRRPQKMLTLWMDARAIGREALNSFFWLSPLLYDSSGIANFSDLETESKDLFSRIESLNGDWLLASYEDLLIKALKETSEISTAIRSEYELLFDKYFDFVEAVPNARPEEISIEEANPLEALARGAEGVDCTSSCVAPYSLVPGVKVYWIRDSFRISKDPIGYALVVPIITNPKQRDPIPLVLTINGPGVQRKMIEPLVALLRTLWNSKEVYQASESVTRETMNYAGIRRELRRLRGRLNLKGKPRSGATHEWSMANVSTWELVTKYLKRFFPDAKNAYERLDFEVDNFSTKHQFFIQTLDTSQRRGFNVEELSVLEKGTLAARYLGFSPSEAKIQATLNYLKLSRDEFLLMSNFRKMVQSHKLDVETMITAVDRLGFPMNQLFDQFDMDVLANALVQLFDRRTELLEEPRWKNFCKELVQRSRNRIRGLKAKGQFKSAKSAHRNLENFVTRFQVALQWQDLEARFSNGEWKSADADLITTQNWPASIWGVLKDHISEHSPEVQLLILNYAFLRDSYSDLKPHAMNTLVASFRSSGKVETSLREFDFTPLLKSSNRQVKFILQKNWMDFYFGEEDFQKKAELKKVLKEKNLWEGSDMRIFQETAQDAMRVARNKSAIIIQSCREMFSQIVK